MTILYYLKPVFRMRAVMQPAPAPAAKRPKRRQPEQPVVPEPPAPEYVPNLEAQQAVLEQLTQAQTILKEAEAARAQLQALGEVLQAQQVEDERRRKQEARRAAIYKRWIDTVTEQIREAVKLAIVVKREQDETALFEMVALSEMADVGGYI